MPPVLEAVWVKSAAYAADPTEIDTKVYSQFGKIDGVVARYKGTSITKPDEHVWIIIWNSKSQHEAFVKGDCASITSPFLSLADAPPFFTTTPLNGADYDKIFASAYVSFSYATAKEGVSKDTIDSLIGKLVAVQQQSSVSNGYFHGEVYEKPGTALSITGWASSDAYHAAATSERVAPILTELRGQMSELDIRYIKVTPFNL